MWFDCRRKLPLKAGHYRVLFDDETEMKSYYHPRYGFSRFWQKLVKVRYWRYEKPNERNDWVVKHKLPLDNI